MNNNKELFVSYFKQHEMDGNQLVNVNRKTFASNMSKFIKNKGLKLKATTLKLYDSLTKFDVSIINWSSIVELEEQQESENNIATLDDVHVYAIKDLDHNQMMYLVMRILHQTQHKALLENKQSFLLYFKECKMNGKTLTD
eukprot:180099_1